MYMSNNFLDLNSVDWVLDMLPNCFTKFVGLLQKLVNIKANELVGYSSNDC